jgi:hypothetical protein
MRIGTAGEEALTRTHRARKAAQISRLRAGRARAEEKQRTIKRLDSLAGRRRAIDVVLTRVADGAAGSHGMTRIENGEVRPEVVRRWIAEDRRSGQGAGNGTGTGTGNGTGNGNGNGNGSTNSTSGSRRPTGPAPIGDVVASVRGNLGEIEAAVRRARAVHDALVTEESMLARARGGGTADADLAAAAARNRGPPVPIESLDLYDMVRAIVLESVVDPVLGSIPHVLDPAAIDALRRGAEALAGDAESSVDWARVGRATALAAGSLIDEVCAEMAEDILLELRAMRALADRFATSVLLRAVDAVGTGSGSASNSNSNSSSAAAAAARRTALETMFASFGGLDGARQRNGGQQHRVRIGQGAGSSAQSTMRAPLATTARMPTRRDLIATTGRSSSRSSSRSNKLGGRGGGSNTAGSRLRAAAMSSLWATGGPASIDDLAMDPRVLKSVPADAFSADIRRLPPRASEARAEIRPGIRAETLAGGGGGIVPRLDLHTATAAAQQRASAQPRAGRTVHELRAASSAEQARFSGASLVPVSLPRRSDEDITAVAYSPSGAAVALGGAAGSVLVYTNHPAHSSGGREEAAAGRPPPIVLLREQTQVDDTVRHGCPIVSIDWSPDGMELLTRDARCAVRLWSVTDMNPREASGASGATVGAEVDVFVPKKLRPLMSLDGNRDACIDGIHDIDTRGDDLHRAIYGAKRSTAEWLATADEGIVNDDDARGKFVCVVVGGKKKKKTQTKHSNKQTRKTHSHRSG